MDHYSQNYNEIVEYMDRKVLKIIFSKTAICHKVGVLILVTLLSYYFDGTVIRKLTEYLVVLSLRVLKQKISRLANST